MGDMMLLTSLLNMSITLPATDPMLWPFNIAKFRLTVERSCEILDVYRLSEHKVGPARA